MRRSIGPQPATDNPTNSVLPLRDLCSNPHSGGNPTKVKRKDGTRRKPTGQ